MYNDFRKYKLLVKYLKVEIDFHLKGCANTSYFVPLRNTLFSLPVINEIVSGQTFVAKYYELVE